METPNVLATNFAAPRMHNPVPPHSDPQRLEASLNHLWTRLSTELRTLVGESVHDIWFADLKLTQASPEEVILLAPGSMYVIWIEENFKSYLASVFEKYFGKCPHIRVIADESLPPSEPSEGAAANTEKAKKPKASTAESKVSHAQAEGLTDEQLANRGVKVGLATSYSFDTFVPGENSDVAWAAAKAVANQPGKTYQPLFFYSASGLGKTHLLNAIGWESLRLRPRSKILSVTAEQFSNDYIDAIQKNALVTFRKRYREVDLLLIDDVQFFGGKEGLQQEFFHTFNRLSDTRKQIVLASDCPASEISQLEERLVTRFQWGLAVEIHRPGLETRAAILRRKRDDWNMDVSDEVIDLIVERVAGNVRVLEGALIRASMMVTMNDGPLRPEQISEVLADICGENETKNVGVDEIKNAVAEHYDVDVAVIDSKKRTARIVEARQVAMFIVRTMTDFSLVEVARAFGKDHGTVIYAVKKIKKRCEESASFKSSVELIKRRLVRSTVTTDSGRSKNPRSAHSLREPYSQGRKNLGGTKRD